MFILQNYCPFTTPTHSKEKVLRITGYFLAPSLIQHINDIYMILIACKELHLKRRMGEDEFRNRWSRWSHFSSGSERGNRSKSTSQIHLTRPVLNKNKTVLLELKSMVDKCFRPSKWHTGLVCKFWRNLM